MANNNNFIHHFGQRKGFIHQASENWEGEGNNYKYYAYITLPEGAVYILRENYSGTEYRYANGGFNLMEAWDKRTELVYKIISEIE